VEVYDPVSEGQSAKGSQRKAVWPHVRAWPVGHLPEFNCLFVDAQQNATVAVPFIMLAEYELAIEQRLKAVDWNGLADEAVKGTLERKLGIV